jgi:hypothetical protein
MLSILEKEKKEGITYDEGQCPMCEDKDGHKCKYGPVKSRKVGVFRDVECLYCGAKFKQFYDLRYNRTECKQLKEKLSKKI